MSPLPLTPTQANGKNLTSRKTPNLRVLTKGHCLNHSTKSVLVITVLAKAVRIFVFFFWHVILDPIHII